MRNLLLTLRFDGTAYHGWQVQKNSATVQETLQDALETILQARPPVTGCSRTDAGVHALAYVCNFRTERAIPCGNLVRALNSCLPDDIAVLSCREVPPNFHARYAAHEKEYIYRILNTPARDPFWRGRALHVSHPLDCGRMAAAAAHFTGTHDFSAFCAAGSSVEDHVRTVSLAQVEREGVQVLFRVRADGFLYNMVRIMAGTLLDIAQGRFLPENVPGMIASRDRAAAGSTAPACGLYLNHIFYEESGWPQEENAVKYTNTLHP